MNQLFKSMGSYFLFGVLITITTLFPFLTFLFSFLSQKVTYYFVMDALILQRVQKCEVRQVTKDVVKSEV